MIATTTHTVLVLGCQRSGTTVTGQILGAHENAVLIDEFEGLYPWFHALTEQAPDAPQLTAQVMHESAKKYKKSDLRYTHENGVTTPAAHISHIVLKAPNLTFDAPKISGLKQQIRILFPHRDPRAVVSSMLRLSEIDFVINQIKHLERAPQVIEAFEADYAMLCDEAQPYWVRAAKMWKIKSGLAATFIAKGLPVMPFKYEDLVIAPQDLIPKILAFCDLPDSMAAHHPEALFQGKGPGGTERTRRIDTQGVKRWSKELNPDQTRDVMQAAAPLAEALGYV